MTLTLDKQLCCTPRSAVSTKRVDSSPGDVHVIHALVSAYWHASIRDRLKVMGPEALPDEASVCVARAIINQAPLDLSGLTSKQAGAARELMQRVAESIARGIIGIKLHDAEHWLGQLADRAHRPMLASALDWGAERVREGRSIGWVKRQLDSAFADAEGKVGLEGTLSGGRAA